MLVFIDVKDRSKVSQNSKFIPRKGCVDDGHFKHLCVNFTRSGFCDCISGGRFCVGANGLVDFCRLFRSEVESACKFNDQSLLFTGQYAINKHHFDGASEDVKTAGGGGRHSSTKVFSFLNSLLIKNHTTRDICRERIEKGSAARRIIHLPFTQHWIRPKQQPKNSWANHGPHP